MTVLLFKDNPHRGGDVAKKFLCCLFNLFQMSADHSETAMSLLHLQASGCMYPYIANVVCVIFGADQQSICQSHWNKTRTAICL